MARLRARQLARHPGPGGCPPLQGSEVEAIISTDRDLQRVNLDPIRRIFAGHLTSRDPLILFAHAMRPMRRGSVARPGLPVRTALICGASSRQSLCRAEATNRSDILISRSLHHEPGPQRALCAGLSGPAMEATTPSPPSRGAGDPMRVARRARPSGNAACGVNRRSIPPGEVRRRATSKPESVS
ncbi:MAG: hypothetical protein QOE54_1370 [Streptosporangiaceae bacterium]|nr:hypothetical protein [Streptosporangiaceae bacterium]